jgi:uncharacterized protein YbbK (DUF523 family)
MAQQHDMKERMKNNSRSVLKLVKENKSSVSFTYNRSPDVYWNNLLLS